MICPRLRTAQVRGKVVTVDERDTCAAWSQERHDRGTPGCGMIYTGGECPEKKPEAKETA